MQSNSLKPSTVADPALIAERLIAYYPKIPAGDPRIYLAGLVELLSSYPSWALERIPSAVHGVPAKFKFLPSISEIKETVDQWVDAQNKHDEFQRRWQKCAPQQQTRPQPIEPGSDYVSMTMQYGRPIGRFEAGTKFEGYAGYRFGGGELQRSPLLKKVVEQARARMEAHRRENERFRSWNND